MCYKILENQDWYQRITADIVEKYNREYYSLVDTAYLNGTITKNTWDFIGTNFSIIPTFYALPKIHKDANNPPGRPIVLGRGALSENASKLMDEHLRPYVTALPSYVKDTIHFLQILNSLHISEHSVFVTIDVEALSSSIPHSKALYIINLGGERDSAYNEFILSLLKFILGHNVFTFH